MNAFDYELATSEDWRIRGQLIRSDIGTSGVNLTDSTQARGAPPTRLVQVNTHGYESWLQVDFNRSSPLTHTREAACTSTIRST